MNPEKQNLIRSNLQLARALSSKIDDVTRFLYQEHIISEHVMEMIQCKRTNTDKGYELMDTIRKHEARALECLYRATLELELPGAASILESQRAQHEGIIPQVTDQPPVSVQPDDELPDKWSSGYTGMDYNELKLVESNHVDMNNLFRQSLTPAGQKHIYQMSGNPRGRVLIISNYEFQHITNRDGTHRDVATLKTLFKALSFDVHVENDKSAQEMMNLLQAEAKSEDHYQYNCFILFILSHGHRGIVFGVDGRQSKEANESTYKLFNYIEIDTIVDMFCKAKSLQGKPKLFFIQADQGNRKSRFHYLTEADDEGRQEGQSTEQQHSRMLVDNKLALPTSCSSSGATSPSFAPSGATQATSSIEHDRHTGAMPGTEYNQPTGRILDTTNSKRIASMSSERAQFAIQKALDENIDKNLHMAVDDVTPSTAVSDAFDQKVTSGADVFLAMATIPGFVTWRSKAYGTWFIQAIVFVFSKYAYKYDLGKLMTMVNRLVGRAETEQGYTQVGEKKDTFQKEFYFFPGLNDLHD